MIYHYVLSVGVVHPYRQLDSQETGYFTVVVHVNLLATCRLIHAEASSILYSQNTFFLPDTDLTVRFFANALHNPIRRAWVKSVYLTLGAHDISESNSQAVESKIRRRYGVFSQARHLHHARKCYLRQVSWPRKAKPILDFLRLDSLVINFSDCTCYRECCRLTASAIPTFQAGFAHGVPAKVEIYGLTPCDAVSSYHVKNPERVKLVKRFLRLWTKKRNQKFMSLREGVKAMTELVARVEQEQEGEKSMFDFNGEE